MKHFLSRLKQRLQPKPKLLSSLDAYSLWAQSYSAEAHNTLMQIEQASMQSLMPKLAGTMVLDLACGTGRYGVLAENAGATRVIGLDNSITMLERGVIQHRACASAIAIPLPTASVDTILCGLALGHLPEIETPFAEMARVLKSNGTLLMSDFHPYQFLSGARRTFSTGQQTYEVEHYVHHISTYIAVGQSNELCLTALAEPTYEQNVPVVLVLRFSKT